MFLRSVALRTGLVIMLTCLAGCPGAEYLWEVRTESTTRPLSFNPAVFEQQPVAVLAALLHRVSMVMRSVSRSPSVVC